MPGRDSGCFVIKEQALLGALAQTSPLVVRLNTTSRQAHLSAISRFEAAFDGGSNSHVAETVAHVHCGSRVAGEKVVNGDTMLSKPRN
jgi:hypothetical protein